MKHPRPGCNCCLLRMCVAHDGRRLPAKGPAAPPKGSSVPPRLKHRLGGIAIRPSAQAPLAAPPALYRNPASHFSRPG